MYRDKQLNPLRNMAWLYAGIMMLYYPLMARGAPLESSELCHHIRLPMALTTPEITDGERITLFGNSVQSLGKDQFSVEGDVLVQQGNHLLSAKKLTYNLSTNYIESDQEIILTEKDIYIRGRSARFNLQQQKGIISNIEYELINLHGRGSAQQVYIDGNHTVLSKASYTTCDPGAEFWKITARELRLDRENAEGSAKHVILSIYHVPVLYLPYFEFPVGNQRKSGLLTPKVHLSDSASGPGFSLPYYFNIAPHLDATLMPHFLSERGLLLNNEFRYLGRRHRGEMDVQYLKNDRKFQADRAYFSLRQEAKLGRANATVDYNYVSDTFFFQHFGNDISISNRTHLIRAGEISYDNPWFEMNTRIQAYQTVDETIAAKDRPYQRLPQIYANLKPLHFFGVDFDLKSEWVNFYRSDDITGTRAHAQPALSLPLNASWGYVKPKIAYWYTAYDLDNPQGNPVENVQRQLPVASVDAGIFLERESRFFQRDYLQTLEPRLFYLYVPFRTQNQITVFDTSEPDFNFTQLFQENRFSGIDRIGDSHHLTALISNHFWNNRTGNEQFRFDLGQIFYFDERRVGLNPTSTPRNQSRSNFLVNLRQSIGPYTTLNAEYFWDPDLQRTERTAAGMYFNANNRSVFKAEYRYQAAQYEQVNAGFMLPYKRWQWFGLWNYSLKTEENIYWLLGLEYRSCCFNIRLARQRYINSINGDPNIRSFLEFEFIGLARMGKKVSTLLENQLILPQKN